MIKITSWHANKKWDKSQKPHTGSWDASTDQSRHLVCAQKKLDAMRISFDGGGEQLMLVALWPFFVNSFDVQSYIHTYIVDCTKWD